MKYVEEMWRKMLWKMYLLVAVHTKLAVVWGELLDISILIYQGVEHLKSVM